MINISVLITNGFQLLFQLKNNEDSGENKYMLPSVMAPTLIGAQRKIKKALKDLGIRFYFIKEIFNKNEGECNHCIYLCSANQYVVSFKEKKYAWIDMANCNNIPLYNVLIDAQQTIVKYIRKRLEIINKIEEIIISAHDQSVIKLDFIKNLNGIQVFMGSTECGCPFSYSFIFDFIEDDKSEYQINWVLNQSLAPGDKSDIYILFSETMGALLKLLLLEPVLIGRMKHMFFDKEISSANILFESNEYNGVIDCSSIVSKAVASFELFNLVMGFHGAFFGSISHEKNNNENLDIIKCLNKKQLNYVVRDEHACYYDDEATCIVVENGTYDVNEFLKGYEFELIDGIYCKLLAQKIRERVFLNYIDNSDWVKIQKIIKKRKFTGYK